MRRQTVGVIAAGVMCLAMAGCNIFGPILFIAHGPPRVKALYDLPRDRPTVVLIDDPDNNITSRQFRLEMAAEIEKKLLEKRKVETLVESQQLLRVLSRERPEDRMSIGEIGRAVGAEIVIWVGVQRFELLQDAENIAPQANLRIKVLDVVAEEKLWPTDMAYHDLVVSMPRQAGEAPDSPSDRRRLMMDLARYAGRATAELFYNEEAPRSARAGN